jgi:hypothetical protein
MYNNPIDGSFDSSISQTERLISEFVSRNSQPIGSGGAVSSSHASLDRQESIGRFNTRGAYEPYIQGVDLNSKLRSADLSPNLNMQALRPDVFSYSTAIYNTIGISPPDLQTFAGDINSSLSSRRIDPVESKYINNPMSVSQSLGGSSATSLIGTSGLESSLLKLQTNLLSNYNITIEVNRVASLDGSSPTALTVTVPNIEIGYDGQIITQEGSRDLLRASSQGKKTFQFTTTDMGGVIEMPTNRYIGQSLMQGLDGQTKKQSAFETTVGYVATFVLQQQVILDQGVTLAFKQFLSNQQTLNPTQNYLELDKFLGKTLGLDSTFSQHVGSMANTASTQDFLLLQQQLGAKLGVGLGTERYSQVSGQELATIQKTAIARIIAPLGSVPNRQAASQMVITNLARELLSPQEVKQAEKDKRTIRVDAFTQLKLQILNSSALGNAELKDQITSMLKRQMSTGRTNLLEQLRSPFLQPHESNFSGAQQLARVAYFAEDRSLLTPVNDASKIMQLSGAYQHGAGGVARGSVNIPISAQTPDNKIYSSQFHDSQLEATGKDTVSFFDLQVLFDGSRQLNTTTLASLGQDIAGYGDKDNWLTQLQQHMYIKDQSQSILITPYTKAEQIPQRLKNLTGTRPSIEYSLDFYRDIQEQKDLSKYYRQDSQGNKLMLEKGKVVSANLNVTMPKLQYDFAVAKQKELEGTDRNLTDLLRSIEANPLSELRGFTTNDKLKRVLVSNGVNQTSDYMHVNSAHEAYYGYEQYTKIEIEGVRSYDTSGGKIYTSNIGTDLQRKVLQTAFEPGRAIYYQETSISDQATINRLTFEYKQVLAKQNGYAAADPRRHLTRSSAALNIDVKETSSNSRKVASLTLQQQYGYLGAITYDSKTDTVGFSLKAGIYGFEKGNITNYGLFDGDTPRLLLGLTPTIDEQGQPRAQQLAVKISGLLRRDQQGVAVTNNLLDFQDIDGRLVGHASYTILSDGSVRPGIENVKGPARYDDRALFDYYASKFDGIDYAYSGRTMTDNQIYATVSSASLKGFSYESGLDVLSTADSQTKFVNKISKNSSTSTALLATHFVDDLSGLLPKSADPSTVASLKQLSTKLQEAIIYRLGQDSNYSNELSGVKAAFKAKKGLASNINTLVNNSGLFALIDSSADGMGLGVNAPLVQLQQSLLRALETGDDTIVTKVVGIFNKAAKDSPLVENGYRVFDQSSGNVRAASMVSTILGLSYQTLDYAQARMAQDPMTKSILELNLIDPNTGRIDHDLIFGKRRMATRDLLQRAKVAMPREETMLKFQAEYDQAIANNQEFKLKNKGHRLEYNKMLEQVANIYASSQQVIPLQMAIYIAPSKILQAAGSKDTANLEYHYSIAMSKRQVDKMRGYVSQPNELTEVAAAYRMLVKFTQSKSDSHLKFISPFLGSEQVADHRLAISNLEYAGTLAQDLNLFGAAQNRTLFHDYARAAVTGDTAAMTKITTGLSLLDTVATTYLGTSDQQIGQRALALASASDSRRLGQIKQQASPQGRHDPNLVVFFDIETQGLIDNRFPAGDERRNPSQTINEISFIFGTGKDAKVVAWKAKKGSLDTPVNLANRTKAINEIKRLLDTQYKNATLVGHNIRGFDIDTLDGLAPELSLKSRPLIDTLLDVDRVAVKGALGTSKLTLVEAYKQVERLRLQGLPNDLDAQAKLKNGDYGEYTAHIATADVRANIKFYEFLVANDLLKHRISPANITRMNEGRLLDNGNIRYYNAAQDSLMTRTAIGLAVSINTAAGDSHLGYHYQTNLENYRTQAEELVKGRGLNAALVLDYAEHLLFKGMNQEGRLTLGKEIENTPAETSSYLYRIALENDRSVRVAVENSLKSNAGTYIDNLSNQALAYKDLSVSLRLSGDEVGSRKAHRLYASLYESRALLMPDLNIGERNNRGTYNVNLVAASADAQGNSRVQLGQSLVYLGADILNHLPKEFGEFVPQIINHRRELDKLIPEYFEIVEQIQRGQTELNQRQRTVINNLEATAVQNRDLIYQALGGALKQRAFGEKSKSLGVSSTSVASYLLQIDEVGLGSRISNVLNQEQLKRIARLQGTNYGSDEVLVLRAGGPSGASQLDQTHKVVSISKLAKAADEMGTYTKLDPKRNQTTSVLPLYGRFSSQGGDFDGDSYGIIGKYEAELKVYADLLEENHKLKQVKRGLEKRIGGSREIAVERYATREYDRALTAELDRSAIREAQTTELGTQVDKALKTGEIDGRKMFNSIYNILGGESRGSKAQFFKGIIAQLREAHSAVANLKPAMAIDAFNLTAFNQATTIVEAAKLTAPNGGAADFMSGIKGKTTTELEAEYLRQQPDQDAGTEQIAKIKAKAYTKAEAEYERLLAQGKYKDIELDEVHFLRQQSREVTAQQQNLEAQIRAKDKELKPLLAQTDQVAERSVVSMRRHVSSYTGLPMSALSKEAGIFSDAAVFNMIEQHRGITPGLEGLSADIAHQGDFNIKLQNTLAKINDSYLATIKKANDITTSNQQLLANPRAALQMLLSTPDLVMAQQAGVAYTAQVNTNVENYIGRMADTEVKRAIQQTVSAVGIETFLNYNPTERLNKVQDFAGRASAVSSAISEIGNIVSKAAGTTLTDTGFHALQDVIGATATGLIGEAYNAITITLNKTIVARSISEALNSHLQVATGIESNGGERFLETTKASFMQTFPDGSKWSGNPDSNKLDQARDLVLGVFDQPAELADAAFKRAQALTGSLANVQQSIRDSLKQKMAGGILQSIMKEPVVGDRAMYDILSSDSGTEKERLTAMRKFLAEDASQSIFQLPGERGYSDRYKVTAFGALFLLNDYLNLENGAQAERMVGLTSPNTHDKNQVESYGFLRDRYQTILAQAQATRNPKLLAMLDADTFIAQSVVDLMAMSSAERTVTQAAFKGGGKDLDLNPDFIVQMQKLREQAMSAFGSKTSYGFTSEAVKLAQSDHFGLDPGQTRTQFHQDIAASLFFNPDTGEDMLKTDAQKITAARKLGLNVNTAEDFIAQTFDFYQRATTNYIYTRNKEYGATVHDLQEMRETNEATKFLRFESVEGNTTFENFTKASASAIDSLATQMYRNQMEDSHQIAAVSYEAGSQLVSAFGEVQKQLESTYGKLDFSKENEQVPLETMRAYHSAQTLSGIFTKLFEHQVADPQVRKYATEMFAISLSTKNAEGNSGYQQLSHFLNGMAQMSQNQHNMMYSGENGVSAEMQEMHDAYNRATQDDKDKGNFTPKTSSAVKFLTGLGAAAAVEAAPSPIIAAQHEAAAVKKQGRTNLISALIGPAFMTLLANAEGDDNLSQHAIGGIQAIAQVADVHKPGRFTAAALFQVDRIKNSMRSEGGIIGSLKGVSSELMFEAASRLAHQFTGSHKGGGARSYLAEVGITALSLLLTSGMSGREYGPTGEEQDSGDQRSVLALQGMAIGISTQAAEDFLDGTAVESDFDTQIEYNATVSTAENNIKEAFASNWYTSENSDLSNDNSELDGGTSVNYNYS